MGEGKYNTIKTTSEGFFKNKGSKFHAYAHRVYNEDDVKILVKDYRHKYYDARHHSYAYILGENSERHRVADDGEPSNTAGTPIFNQIRSKELTNVFIMVVRYFGGTKLGVPGLIEAYGESAKNALENAIVIEEFVKFSLFLSCDYTKMNIIMKTIKDFDLEIVSQNYDEKLNFELLVKKIDFTQVENILEDYTIKD